MCAHNVQVLTIFKRTQYELIEFSSGIKLPATFEYKEGRKIYVALILSANDVPAARKICGHASHAVKCHRCPKHAKYDHATKRNHY
ncbi:14481_t:CDS:2, partial [Dentiscutata heterogama]